MHVEAGGQSDLVGKRSRCDSTDSVENLGTFAHSHTHTHTRMRARERTHAYARVEHVVTAAVGVRERRLGGKGGEKKKDAPSLEGRERARGIKRTFYWKQHDESEGSERVKRDEADRGEDRERPCMFCLKENVSYIRNKGGNREGGG